MDACTLPMVAAILVSIEAAKPRSVNVALETVFEFEKTSDIEFLNNIQNIISKIKDVIEEDPDRSSPTRRKQRYKFTDFLENLITNLNKFNDDVLKEVVQTIDTEIRKVKDTDTLQTNIKVLLLNKFDGIKIKSAQSIRKNFDNLLTKLKSTKDDKDSYFFGFLNTLYKKESERKLTNFMRKLKIFQRSHRKSQDFQKTIQKAVKLIIFDHFSNLSHDTKSMVESQIKDYINDDYLRVNINKHSLEYERTNVKIKPIITLHNFVGKRKKEKIIKRPKIYHVIKNIKRKRINKTPIAKTIGIKTYPTMKSTHITLYPEILDRRNIGNFRDTNLVRHDIRKLKDSTYSYKYETLAQSHNNKLKGTKYENIFKDGLALSSISHSAEINVNFIGSNRDESNDVYRPVKIRASSSTKNHKSTKRNKRLKYERKQRRNITKEIYSTPESSIEHFGSLFKNKPAKIGTERSPYELNKQNEEGTLKYTKLDEKNIYLTEKITKGHTYTNENTERSLPDQQPTASEATWEINNVSKLERYRRPDSFNASKDINVKNINNSQIHRREPNKNTVVTSENFDISKLLEWYRRAKTDGLEKYVNATHNENSEITKRNRSYNKIITTEVSSKNVITAKSGSYRRANELNSLKEGNIRLSTKFKHIPTMSSTENNLLHNGTINEKISSNFTESDIINEIPSNITESKRAVKENCRKSFFDVTVNLITTTKDNVLNEDKEIVDAKSKNGTFEAKITNIVNSSFDVKSYIKNSDVKNIEDEEKRKEIERKMKQDLDRLFASPTTNATAATEAYTDIFEALDDAFDLSPLK